MMINNILNSVIKMPTNFNLSYNFNSGSLLGYILMVQVISGILISTLFNPSVENFYLLIKISNESFFFFFLRFFHSNGASFFFFIIIFHSFRNFFFFSFKKNKLFMSGIFIYLILMMISFFGYVLPWGQMSFWGSSVITNFLSVLSNNLVFLLWGDFMPGMKLMFFFFCLHFFLPFFLMFLTMMHILLLHEISSSSKIFKSGFKKKNLHFFLIKDIMNFFMIFIYYIFIFYLMYSLGDSENFILSNKMVTPNHIKPEWYFLWVYSILRAIPSKLGGVIMLLSSIIFLLKFIFIKKSFFMKKKKIFLFCIFFILTFLGSKPVEMPYLLISQIFTLIYFFFILF